MRNLPFEKMSVFTDWILFAGGFLAILVLALEDLGIVVPGINDNLAQLTFVGVCLLIISTIWERRLILAKMDDKLDDVLRGFIPASYVLRTGQNEEPLTEMLREAKSIAFAGATLSTTIRSYRNEFTRLAKKGCCFRFLLVDPDAFPTEREEKRLFKRTALIELSRMLQDAPPGSVEVRLLDRYPSDRITVIESSRPGKSAIIVELFGYKTSKNDRPRFVLYENQDLHWFSFFQDSFEMMWADAKPFIGLPS